MTPGEPTNQPQVTPRWKAKANGRKRRDRYDDPREWQAVRELVRERANGACEAGVRGVCQIQGAHAHHVILRSQGGRDEADNLLWLCFACHDWIHHNPAKAMEFGWIRSGVDQ